MSVLVWSFRFDAVGSHCEVVNQDAFSSINKAFHHLHLSEGCLEDINEALSGKTGGLREALFLNRLSL